jgi:hypothetical protein
MVYLIGIFGILLPRIGYIDLSVMPLILGLIYDCFKHKNFTIFGNRSLSISIALLFIWFVISCISLIINNSGYLHNILVPLRASFLLIGWYQILIRRQFTLNTILIIFVCAALLNGIFIYYQYVADYFNLSIPHLYHNAFTSRTTYRQPGLFAGYSPSSALNAIGAACALYLSIGQKVRYYLFYNVIFIVILASIFLSGRTGLIIILLFIGANLIFAKAKLKYISIFFTIIIGLSLFKIYLIAPPDIKKSYQVAFEFIFNYTESHEMGTYSTKDIIQNHYHIPSDVQTLLIGNGLEFNSDVAFIQIWYSSGIFAMLTATILISYIVFVSPRCKKYVYITTFIYFSLFLVCFKGSYLFSRITGDLMIILYSANIVLTTDEKLVIGVPV